MADQSIVVSFPNGDTLPIAVTFETAVAPPINALHPHIVTFGTSTASQFSVTLTPGAIVKPVVLAPNAPVAYGALTFSDDFLSQENWGTYWTPLWFGGSTINGTAISAGNVTVGAGVLELACANNTGALVSTNPSGGASPGFAFEYGIVEARIQLPGTASGAVSGWPAFWTDGQNWPVTGEADIVEGLSGSATSNYHSAGSTGGSTDHPDNSGPIPGNWAGAYHTYTLDRQPGMNYVYWDGKLVRSYATYDGGAPQYLLLTHGPGPSGTGNNTSVLVDYVRAWEAA